MLGFISDTHIGVNRRTNTTVESRKKLYDRVIRNPLEAVLEAKSEGAENIICAGDLFDKFSNKEHVILDACELFSNLHSCLAGNHDIINDSTKKSSLDIMGELFPHTTYIVGTGESKFHVELFEDINTCLYYFPHHSAQSLMEISLLSACEDMNPDLTNIFIVHCNYGLPDEFTNDVTLNLTEEDIDYLLNEAYVDYVLFGHDHHSREYHKGRVRILGNTQPTSFSDIGNKYISFFDGTEFTKKLIWDTSKKFKELSVNKDWPELPEEVEFIDVVGSIPPQGVSSELKRIKELWDHYPNLLAVRNSIQIDELSGLLDTEQPEELSSVTIYDLIDSHIKNTDIYPLWLEMTKGIE